MSVGPSVVLAGRGLVRHFGGVAALDGVDFSLDEHEVVGVIGPNGSGKTTLFNVLSGALRPTAGAVLWHGRSLGRTRGYRRARMGLGRTFQQAMVFPGLSVAENVHVACVAARQARAGPRRWEGRELLEYVHMDHLAENLAGDLSWGQSRVLGVALALALNPEALLLDEPFAGLSPVAVGEVVTILERIKADGYPLAIIDHELEYVLPLCDRLMVMETGRKIADGPPDEVIALAVVQQAYLGEVIGDAHDQ